MSKQIEQLKQFIDQMYQFYVDHTVISLAIIGVCAFALFVIWDHIKHGGK